LPQKIVHGARREVHRHREHVEGEKLAPSARSRHQDDYRVEIIERRG
jgi:hypothetical protein